MAARVIMAIGVLLLQILTHTTGQRTAFLMLSVSLAYLLATVLMWVLARPPSSNTLGLQWLPAIALDLLVFCMLQVLQSSGINYTPLFGLPLLLASVLGSLLVALGTAATITMLLLADAWSLSLLFPGDHGASYFLQAALTGTGYFIVAFLVHQLASRLAREEQLAMLNQLAATVQIQVNELVIETLDDGVMIVDHQGTVRAANPSARGLLGAQSAVTTPQFPLSLDPAWGPLYEQAQQTFEEGHGRRTNLTIQHTEQSPRKLHVTTRLTSSGEADAESLCVVFLRDLREMEARLRTEKLAAMGRMSAAVAHEIRNPLAAIMQANELLDEELQDLGQKRLTLMVRQNAQRLTKITEDVLDVARVRHQIDHNDDRTLKLDENVGAFVRDWMQTTQAAPYTRMSLNTGENIVIFEPDHLRRVLVNLLDNALRYIRRDTDSLQISTDITASGHLKLQVWSDGPPMEKTVEDYLFEPFFSSESRSSGLGLYICRELCNRHGASINYQRTPHTTAQGLVDGNAFFVIFRSALYSN